MKIINFLITILFFTNIYSQRIEGKIIYKLSVKKNIINKDTIAKKDKNYSAMLNFINQSLRSNKFTFQLLFNENESSFSKEDIMLNDSDKSYKIASALVKAEHIYYVDKVKNIRLINKHVYGKLYLVENEFDNLNWTLNNERKKIGNYNCFKATTFIVINNSKGEYNKKIIAWYAPELALNFGPKGYGGLPGMILELTEDKYLYSLDKIVLNPKKKVRIKLPKKGTLITQKKLDEIGEEKLNKKKRALKN
jgi:GLPGLI family protein